jgi:hypothetical protein
MQAARVTRHYKNAGSAGCQHLQEQAWINTK